MKKIACRGIIAAAVLCAAVAAVLPAQGTKVTFNWAFVKRAADGSPAPIDFRERVSISPGDLFKIHVQPVQDAFVYVLLEDAQGTVQVLFPESFDTFDSQTYMGTRFFIPEGEEWFTPDSHPGTERFYLLASRERLRPLEGLVRSCARASAGAKGPAEQAVLDEIARLRRTHSQLTMAAEKPVTIAGGTRGITTAIQKVATRIEATEFYYKLFRLEH